MNSSSFAWIQALSPLPSTTSLTRTSDSPGLLPGRLYLCGGGARLPQIGAALRNSSFARQLSFARPPQVESITVNEVAQIRDVTGLLVDEQDVPPMALAHQALEMGAPETPLDGALKRVLRQLKV